jgi:DNA-directed RNA polymerase subunit omega
VAAGSEQVANRVEFIRVASKRARQISNDGVETVVEQGNDKPTVVALREIAEGKINASILDEIED